MSFNYNVAGGLCSRGLQPRSTRDTIALLQGRQILFAALEAANRFSETRASESGGETVHVSLCHIVDES